MNLGATSSGRTRERRRRTVRARARAMALWLVPVCGFLAGGAGAQTTGPLAMSNAPACTQCHLVWLDDVTLPRDEILVPYAREADFMLGKQGAESNDLMCYSCHDGYVADSRARIRLGNQHPMAGITKLRRRPESLPLLREEEVYCGTCHTPHGPMHETAATLDIEQNAFLRLAARPGPVTLCTQCHEYTTSTLVGNHPLGHPEFKIPPELVRAHAFTETEQGGIGCLTCHSPHGTGSEMLVIFGDSGESSPTLCLVCHKRDSTKTGLGRYSHPMGVPPLPGNPKPTFANGEPIPTTPAGKMNCLTCHDVHESGSPQFILREPVSDGTICNSCHPGLADAIQGGEHDLRVYAPQSTNILGKTPAQSGLCASCHIPHRSPTATMWARSVRGTGNIIDRQCLSCHAPGGIARSTLRGFMNHPTEVDKGLIRVRTGEAEPTLQIPIYDDEGRKADKGAVTCMTCHDPHKWQAQGPPVSSYPPAGQGSAVNSFLRARSQDQICKHCHGIRSLWRYKYFHSPLRLKD